MTQPDTTDAMEWAKEFIRVTSDPIRYPNADPGDLGFMVSWFANAIEMGRNHSHVYIRSREVDGREWAKAFLDQVKLGCDPTNERWVAAWFMRAISVARTYEHELCRSQQPEPEQRFVVVLRNTRTYGEDDIRECILERFANESAVDVYRLEDGGP